MACHYPDQLLVDNTGFVIKLMQSTKHFQELATSVLWKLCVAIQINTFDSNVLLLLFPTKWKNEWINENKNMNGNE